jgi:endo-1,4-beta-xylanase
MVEITRLATEQARVGNPKAVRIVNSCCLWAEYMKGQSGPDVRVCTPQQFLDRLRAAKVDYDVIGLQFYYPSRDLLEISRMIDRFARFGKPVQITEVAAPSSAEGDEYSYWKDPNAVRAMGVWHRPWDEELQVEWMEGFYTICYSKPFVEAITWWDFADYRPGHFFPHGGFLDHEYVPKKSFFHLKRLINRWRRMG